MCAPVGPLLCAGLPGYLTPRTKADRSLLTLAQFQEIFDKWLLGDNASAARLT